MDESIRRLNAVKRLARSSRIGVTPEQRLREIADLASGHSDMPERNDSDGSEMVRRVLAAQGLEPPEPMRQARAGRNRMERGGQDRSA